MSRQTDNAANAIRSLLGRGMDQRQQLGEYGIVKRVNPLEIELVGSDDTVGSDELVVTQAVRQYDRDVGLKAGDSLTLVQMDGGELVAVGVISDTKLVDSNVTKEYVKVAVEGVILPGLMIPSGRSTATPAPDGWLYCDGTAVSRTTYARLFAAIGTGFGVGDGSTTFNVPDVRSRSPVGADPGQAGAPALGAGLTSRARGAVGGEETHATSIAEMPTHDHGAATVGANANLTVDNAAAIATLGAQDSFSGTTSGQNVNFNGYATGTAVNPGAHMISSQWGTGATGVTGSTWVHTHTFSGVTAGHAHTVPIHGHTVTQSAHAHTINPQGSSTPHNNLSPYIALPYLIKT